MVDNGDPENGAIEQSRWTVLKYDPYTDQLKEKILSDGKRYVYIPHAVHYSLTDRVEVYQPEGEGETLAYWRQNTYNPLTWRLASTTTPEGTIGYEYTDDGQLKRTTTSTGLDVHYTYDALGNLKTVASKQLSASGTEIKVVTYFYDAATGRRTRVENPNGTSTDYEYHDRGWTSRITHKRGSTVLLDLDYTRDDRGLIIQTIETRENQPQVTWTYIYDDARRLIDATRVTAGVGTEEFDYTYDDAGNRLTKFEGGVTTTYTYNSLDQIVSDGTTTYEWDIFGNLKREIVGGNTKREFTWDAENHLVSVLHHNPDWVVVYSYNSEGVRIARQQDSFPSTYYLTDNLNLTEHSQVLTELSADNSEYKHNYLYSESLIAESGDEVGCAIVHTDDLGSVRLLSEPSGNSIGESVSNYEPFGAPLGTFALDFRHRFTGEWLDIGTGLQYHRARWLNTSTGRWLSRDSLIDFPHNFANAYSYCANSPLNWTDPTGNALVELLVVSAILLVLIGITAFAWAASRYLKGDRALWSNFFKALAFILIFTAICALIGGIPGVIFGGLAAMLFVWSDIFNPGHPGRFPEYDAYYTHVGYPGYPTSPDGPIAVPPNVDIAANTREALAHPFSYSMQGKENAVWFFNKVRNYRSSGLSPEESWDYKNTKGSEYTDFGNWHFGYMARAAGWPREIVLRAAGWAHQTSNYGIVPHEYGHPYGSSPHGDDPRDQAFIVLGMNAYDGEPATD